MRIFGSLVDPALIGRFERAGVPPEALYHWIDVEEIVAHGGGVGPPSRSPCFNSVNADQDGAVFTWGGSATPMTEFTRSIPADWAGSNIQLLVYHHHDESGLAGSGSPPDDQVHWELGYETLADGVAFVDLGDSNDGTAPHEVSTIVQLGTTQEAPKFNVLATITTGASDKVIHARVTRPQGHADDGLDANIYVLMFGYRLEPSA